MLSLLRRATERFREVIRETAGTMLALGATTGLVTGLLAAGLIGGIRVIQHAVFGGAAGTLEVLLWPAAGALAVGLLERFWAAEPAGSGVVRIMETLALHGGRTRHRVPAATLAATSLALGTGASGGREGPIVLLGGSVGSILGQWFTLSEQRVRALVAAGAAAGIGASFNAPIGGMLFAIELILRRLRAASLQVVVIGSVVGSVTARLLVGPGIIYAPATTYRLGDPRELVLYAGLGVVAAVAAVALAKAEELARRASTWLRDRELPLPAVVAASGLAVGAAAVFRPEILGTGDDLPPVEGLRDPIQAMLDGAVGTGWSVVGLLVLLAVLKIAATAVTVGFGNAVGTFAPAVFIGAAVGGAFGTLSQLAFPGLDIQSGAFALVGTAAVFGAAASAPLTAILITFELTGDYELVLPLMLAAGIATFLADRIAADSIYEAPLRQRGIIFSEPEDIDVMQVVDVDEIISDKHPTVTPDLGLSELQELFDTTRSHGFAVVTPGGRLHGVVTVTDLAEADPAAATVADICTDEPAAVSIDAPVHRALQRMAALDIGRIPAVEGRDRYRGLVRRGDIVRAYQHALARKLDEHQHEQATRLRDLTGLRPVEMAVDDDAEIAGVRIRDVEWPPRTLLTSIRRGSDLLLPTGDTVLWPGDDLVLLADPEQMENVRAKVVRSPTLADDT